MAASKSRKRKTPLTFSSYQRAVERTDASKKFFVSLLGLVGEIGDIQTVVKRRQELGRYPTYREDIAEELGIHYGI